MAKQEDPEVNDEDEEDERYQVDLNGDFMIPESFQFTTT